MIVLLMIVVSAAVLQLDAAVLQLDAAVPHYYTSLLTLCLSCACKLLKYNNKVVLLYYYAFLERTPVIP
jgi:hypothetical protein